MKIKKGLCVKTFFTREILCAGTMTDYLFIYSNELKKSGIGQLKPEVEKTILYRLYGRIENVNPSARYAGIKMTPNTPEGKSSHVIYLPFEQAIFELDINVFFIELENIYRNRFFKMNKIENVGEQYDYLAVWCNETGFSDLEAAGA